jgi:excisionase family DNA binding protein
MDCNYMQAITTSPNHTPQSGSFSPLLTPEQTAALLGQKVGTIWSWCRSGKLPHIRLSRRSYKIRQSDLEEFLRRNAR